MMLTPESLKGFIENVLSDVGTWKKTQDLQFKELAA